MSEPSKTITPKQRKRQIIAQLRTDIEGAAQDAEAGDVASWRDEIGVLLSLNEAVAILGLLTEVSA